MKDEKQHQKMDAAGEITARVYGIDTTSNLVKTIKKGFANLVNKNHMTNLWILNSDNY